jgi:ankyrin repeat protein
VENHLRWSQPKALEVLLKAGAKIDLVDKEGQTALHLAARSDNAEAVQPLVKANHTRASWKRGDKRGERLAACRGAHSLRAVEFPKKSEVWSLRSDCRSTGSSRADILLAIILAPRPAFSSRHGVPRAEFRIAYFLQKGFKPIDIKDKQGATPALHRVPEQRHRRRQAATRLRSQSDVRTNTALRVR